VKANPKLCKGFLSTCRMGNMFGERTQAEAEDEDC